MCLVRFFPTLPLQRIDTLINSTSRWTLTCILLSLTLTGCGSNSNLPKGETGTVKGKISYQGKPVPEGCRVTFMGGTTGLVATGVTDSSGEFLLYMRNGLDVLCGTYRVSILPPNPSANLSDTQVMELSMAGKLPDTSKMKEVPDRYRNPETTKEVFEVKPGSNNYELDMKD